MFKTFKASLLCVTVVLLSLSGCRTSSPFYVLDGPERIQTRDADVQRQRFGLLAEFVGRPMARADGGGLFVYTAWLVPGAAMILKTDVCCEERIIYDPDIQGLIAYHEVSKEDVSAYGKVGADGKITWRSVYGGEPYTMVRTSNGYEYYGTRYVANQRWYDEAVAHSRGNWQEVRARQMVEEAEEERENAQLRARAVGELVQSAVSDLSRQSTSSSRPYTPPAPAQARAAQSTSQPVRIAQSTPQPARAVAPQQARAEQAQTTQARLQEQASAQQAANARKAQQDAQEARQKQERERQAAAAEQESRRKRQAEADEQQRKERRERDYLLGLTRTIKMAAKTCGGGDIRVGGVMPAGQRVVENVRVNFTVHCPGRAGVSASNNYFLGDGYSCVGSDMVNVKIPCEAEKSRVTVDSVVRSN
jgi:hypothetical protein